MNKILKNLIINQKGGTAILITLLILFAIFTVTITASDIVLSGLKMSKERYDSTKAYFAAEAGAERIIWEIRKNSYIPGDGNGLCPDPGMFCYSNVIPNIGITECVINTPGSCTNPNIDTVNLSNGAGYQIVFDYLPAGPTTTLSCLGQYASVGRRVKLEY